MATFQTSSDGNIKILAIEGHLGPQSGQDLKVAIDGLTDGAEGADLIVDMENLTYMASAGFRELFMAGRKLGRANGRLVVSCLRGEVKRVFELAGFDTAYNIYETRQEALDYLKTPRTSA